MVDDLGRVRRVAFGKKNTYRQFVDNGVAKWHAVSPYKVKINMNATLVWQMADDSVIRLPRGM
jgi:hypothetical protein